MRLDSAIRNHYPGVANTDDFAPLLEHAISRCLGSGVTQYVDEAGERWHRVPPPTLLVDAREEVADCLAYVVAYVQRTGDRELLSRVHDPLVDIDSALRYSLRDPRGVNTEKDLP